MIEEIMSEACRQRLHSEETAEATHTPRRRSHTNKASSFLLLALFGAMVAPCSAFHYNENSNSIYPSKKSSSSSSSKSSKIKVYYQSGNSDSDLPVCSPHSVCNKFDTYGKPWVEKQCKCPAGLPSCSASPHPKDGHTVMNNNKLYKTCEPVKRLKKCKFFHDVTWSIIGYPDNTTQQIMHCRCPRNSITYLHKTVAFQTPAGEEGKQFNFVCSPPHRMKCQRKEPCRLFTVRKDQSRPESDSASLSSLCACPRHKKCPKHHLDVGVIPGVTYNDTEFRTYAAYCM